MDPETLVHRYLGDLEEAASDLAPHRRAELVGDVRGHIELALAEAGIRDEAAVRDILARLGGVDEIVAADAGGRPAARGSWPVSRPAEPARAGSAPRPERSCC
jgi:hypothetical protein